MKIEKLTDNKIRIIIKSEDLLEKNININSDTLILEMLDKAEKELNFNTDGCKLLIESFSSIDDIFVITITKNSNIKPKKSVTLKRKTIDYSKTNSIFKFENFDTFCEFCKSLSKIHNFKIDSFSKDISLYLYNNTYYLIVKNINTNSFIINRFYVYISEFSKCISYSSSFENKLLEHGDIIIEKNALNIGIQYFI